MALETIARLDTLDARVAMEIKLMLTKRGQNQAALARALEVPAMWVSDRLRGRVQWTLVDLARIAGVLGVDVVDLIGRAEKGSDGTYSRIGSSVPDVHGVFISELPRAPIIPAPRGPVTFGDARRGSRSVRNRALAVSA